MCGIAGIVYFKGQAASEQLVRRMTDAMQHRGPDSDGFYCKGPAALGHRRLSIIDLSDVANQPFGDASRRFNMVFNGEMYNYQDVRRTIPDHSFRTNSDTEVLLEAYARKGIDCLHEFKGMFAFAVWDEQEQELCLVRDRLGVKPLYYYINDEYIVFASEARAILQSGLVAPRLNMEAVFDYLSFQSVSSPSSIIKDIKQLEAGHYLTVKDGRCTIDQYWNVARVRKEFDFSEPQQVTRNIRNLLKQSVNNRLVSDVPVGAFLSGGIDSSAVVGLMSEVSATRPNTFNIAFDERDFDESAYAELLAKKFNTNHHRIVLKPTAMLDELDNALAAIDSPSGDGINTYVVSKAVKNAGITVALSGIGGDELFAGYPFFKKFHSLNKQTFLWNNTAGIRKLLSGMTRLYKKNAVMKLEQLLHSKTSSITDIYPVLRQVIPARYLQDLLPASNGNIGTVATRLRNEANHLAAFPSLSQVSIAEYLGYTQQTLLKDTDQMSMAVSLEVREPFFDHELIEYVLNVPDTMKYPRYPKSLLVESLQGLLPDDIVHRKKQGFVFPWSRWMRQELYTFCDQHIKRLAERDFINGEVKIYWQRFIKNDPSVKWMDIWLFVILEHWLEKNGVS